MSLFPGLFLAGAVLSLNLLGDAVRDALDPRTVGTRRRRRS
jgi:ABC-type dipeptide/oligopeptide/nickel transport system permease subunit